MNIEKKDLFSILLFVAGLAVLGSSFLGPRAQPDLQLEQAESIGVDPERLLTAEELGTQSSLAAVFLLHPKVCPPCLQEVSEYVQLIRALGDRGIAAVPLALVVEDDPEKVDRFAKVAELPLSVRQSPGHDGLMALLGTTEEQVWQQMVWIDLDRERVFYRVMLRNRPTGSQYKREVLERVLAERAGFRAATHPRT